MLATPTRPSSFKLSTPSTDENSNSPGTASIRTRSNSSHGSVNPNVRSSFIPSNSIGSQWTVEMVTLKQCGSYFEAAQCLRRIRELLNGVDRVDRLKFCKADYNIATKALRKHKDIWSDELFKEVVAITIDYFNVSPFQRIPTVVLQEIFQWIVIDEFTPITCVCWEWCEAACANAVWQTFYQQKFLLNNPRSGIPHYSTCMMTAFRKRLADPFIGDMVEVAWRGKFRLETQDVYQGLAWWVAKVVDKHPSQGRYKIRYPGWESRWDEWVPRARLRWTVSRNTVVSIQVGDVVELWCCGANVPGAWLESKVKRVRGNRYCLGRVLSSGYLWVERNRLRLVRRPQNVGSRNGDAVIDPVLGQHRRSSRLRVVSNSLTSLSERINNVTIRRPEHGSCVVM